MGLIAAPDYALVTHRERRYDLFLVNRRAGRVP